MPRLRYDWSHHFLKFLPDDASGIVFYDTGSGDTRFLHCVIPEGEGFTLEDPASASTLAQWLPPAELDSLLDAKILLATSNDPS